MKKLLLLSALLAVGVSGCGSAGGGAANLATSYITASAKTVTLDSDVATWIDSAGAKATACGATSNPSVTKDSVDVEIASKAYSNITNGLPIRIERATVTYTPLDTKTPAMAPAYQTVGTTITNGGTATIPVTVVSQTQKSAVQNKMICTGSNITYSYAVNISFDLTEIGSGSTSTVNTSMNVYLSDFIDK